MRRQELQLAKNLALHPSGFWKKMEHTERETAQACMHIHTHTHGKDTSASQGSHLAPEEGSPRPGSVKQPGSPRTTESEETLLSS